MPSNSWNPDAGASWEAGSGRVPREQSNGSRVSFSSWSPRCRIQPLGRKLGRIKRKYVLWRRSRHSRKLRLRWNTETHAARGSGVTTTRWACTSEWPTPIMHKDPEPWQQDQSQSYPSGGAGIAKIFQALVMVGSKHDV